MKRATVLKIVFCFLIFFLSFANIEAQACGGPGQPCCKEDSSNPCPGASKAVWANPDEIRAGQPPCICEGSTGLIHCGGKGQAPCTLCDFFILFSNVITWLLTYIVPPIAVLMALIGGVTFLFAGADPKLVNQGKQILTSTVIGLVLIYGAWVFTNTILTAIGVAEWTGLQDGWFEIQCEKPTPPTTE